MVSYEVVVKTGDKKGAGTDANVQIVLIGASGQQTKPAFLNHVFTNNFERGQLDVFNIEDETDIPEVQGIKLQRDEAGVFSDWFVEKVEVTSKKSGNTSIFPVLRWIRPNTDVVFQRYDTSLPQFDPNSDQRNAELQEKKKLYEYSHLPGLPAGVRN
jgi:arachidonate 5-lipoxygenase